MISIFGLWRSTRDHYFQLPSHQNLFSDHSQKASTVLGFADKIDKKCFWAEQIEGIVKQATDNLHPCRLTNVQTS